MSAFPPHRSVASIPVSQEVALKYLSTYVAAAQSTPYLQPNARLSQTGPTAGASGSSVTMHNLQRVEAGLRGEWLAPTLDMEEAKAVKVTVGMDDGVAAGTQQDDGVGDGNEWQDLEDYQREQDIEEGGDGTGMPEVVQYDGDDAASVDVFREQHEYDSQLEGAEIALEHNIGSEAKSKSTSNPKGGLAKTPKSSLKRQSDRPEKPKDKEARKLEKKARRKQELRSKEEARKKSAKSQ